MYESDAQGALDDLVRLTALGPRFHGTPGIHKAQQLLTSWLHEAGATVETHQVQTADWRPGDPAHLRVTTPVERKMVAWPMLWSGPSQGTMKARLHPVGLQGLWGDAMTWTKYAAMVGDQVVGYVHARDDGPAAPQPLPVGSDTQLPHVAIGRIDGLAISEWLDDGYDVEVVLEASSGPAEFVVSESLTVDIPVNGTPTGGRVIVCGHYDTFWNTPGAYDNGSGTIALLHLARSLLSSPIGRRVTIAHLTAEEWHPR